MTREEAERLLPGCLLITPFEGRGIVRFVSIHGDHAMIQFAHEHYGYPQGSDGAYPISELTPLNNYEPSCTDGDGHTSHDFNGPFLVHYCRKCELSVAAVEFLKKQKERSRVPP